MLSKLHPQRNTNNFANRRQSLRNQFSRTAPTLTRRFQGSCFICNRIGHGYMQCYTASDTQKQEIKEKLEKNRANNERSLSDSHDMPKETPAKALNFKSALKSSH